MATVKLGPVPQEGKGLCPMLKEIGQRKSHLDVTFICDNGTLHAHRVFIGAQSEFLKNMFLDLGTDRADVRLVGVKLEHLKLAVRMMYTGRLKVTKSDLYKTSLVWYVKEIITKVLRIDTNLHLGSLNLKPPPGKEEEEEEDHDPPNPPGPSSSRRPDTSNHHRTRRNGNSSGETSTSNSRGGGGGGVDLWPAGQDPSPRQNSAQSQLDRLVPSSTQSVVHIPDDAQSDLNPGRPEEGVPGPADDAPAAVLRRESADSDDIELLEPPRVPTPDMVDLLDSDKECEETGTAAAAAGDKFEINESYSCRGIPARLVIPSAPKLIKKGEKAAESDGASEDERKPVVGVNQDSRPKRRGTGEGSRAKTKRKNRPAANLAPIKKDRATKKKTAASRQVNPQTRPSDDLIGVDHGTVYTVPPPPLLMPNQVVYRGEIVDLDTLAAKEPVPSTSAPKKYTHVPWTVSGLKRVETLAVVKQEDSLHHCDQCENVYVKYKSLEIHKQRSHNSRLCVKCAECGKLVSSEHAMKKHLLSHRPKSSWPFACPLCHKRFQARGDLPKHFMTKLHENDNIPKMGTLEWMRLVYYDKQDEFAQDMLVKTERQSEKERSKLIGPEEEGGPAVSVEEYDSWLDGNVPAQTPTNNRKRKRGQQLGKHGGSPGGGKKKAATSVPHQPTRGTSDRPSRSAARAASIFLSELYSEEVDFDAASNLGCQG